MLRSSTMPGTPFNAFSIGILMALSASTADSPPVRVKTDTCTVVTSGMASMGKRAAANPPARRSIASMASMAARASIE
jgi:hypothetical protein